MYGITVLSSYAIIMLMATLLLTKRETVAEKFYVGDRHMGTLQSAMSIAATWIWAPALFVSAEKAYANGFVGLFWFLVPNILCLLLFIPFARKIRERMPHGISLAGFMGEQYHSVKAKGIYLFQLGSLSVLSTGVQLLAGGKILSTITGIPMFAMTVILAAIAYSYSQFSGIKASVMTDAVQMIIMLAVCAILIPWALSMPGNTQALARGITGVRAAESIQRARNIASMTTAGNKMTNRHQVLPIYDWSNNDAPGRKSPGAFFVRRSVVCSHRNPLARAYALDNGSPWRAAFSVAWRPE